MTTGNARARQLPFRLVLAALLTALSALARAQGLTEAQRDLVATLLPGSERLFAASDRFRAAGAAIHSVAAGMQSRGCAMDGQLIALGGALQSAVDPLRRLEPLLLAKSADIIRNYQALKAYRAAVAGVGDAAGGLTSLDAIGSAGPPEKATLALRNAGRALAEIEQSGIGLYLQHMGDAAEEFRKAQLRLDRSECAQAARFLAGTARLAAESLALTSGTLAQSAAVKTMSLALLAVSSDREAAGLDTIGEALDFYLGALRQQSVSLRRLADTAGSMQASAGLHGLAERYRAAAAQLAHNAATVDLQVASIAAIRELARGAATPATMRSLGSALRNRGTWRVLIQAGEAFEEAAVHLDSGRKDAARKTLSTMAGTIMRLERALWHENLDGL